MTKRKETVLGAFNESVAAADWIQPSNAVLVATGKRLAAALDEVSGADEYSALSRLSLELRNVARQLGLTVEQVPVAEPAGEISPLAAIREFGA